MPIDQFNETAVRGFLASVDVVPVLKVIFQFNPSSMRDSKTVQYTEKPSGRGGDPRVTYSGAALRRLSFDLQLHGLERGHNAVSTSLVDNGVAPGLAVLRSFLYPRSTAWGQLTSTGPNGWLLHRPPKCIFGFGSRVLHCYVTQLSVTEEQFNAALTPVRATVGVELTIVEDACDPLNQLETQRRLALAAVAL